MTIFRIVLFKIKEDATANDIHRFYNGLSLLSNIKHVQQVKYGSTSESFYQNYSLRNAEYNHVLLVTFHDSAGFEYYDKSALLEEVKVQYIFPLLDNTKNTPVIAVNYKSTEFQTSKSFIETGSIIAATALVTLLTILAIPILRNKL